MQQIVENNKVLNLARLQREFPAVDWNQLLHRLWMPIALSALLEGLWETRKTVIVFLKQYLGIPEEMSLVEGVKRIWESKALQLLCSQKSAVGDGHLWKYNLPDKDPIFDKDGIEELRFDNR